MHKLVTIKGDKDGLRLQLDASADWPTLLADLQTQLEQSGGFFAGAHLLLDVGDRALSEGQLAEMLALMHQYGVRPAELAASSRESRTNARAAGLMPRVLPGSDAPPVPVRTGDEALLVARTVRSGQVLRHHGHVTLIGDLNAGAQVIAGGSVVVWGRLRGMVHAGAFGNEHAWICALELRPTQLRIAHVIARTPEQSSGPTTLSSAPYPEVALVEEGRIYVEAWDVNRR